MSGILIAAGLVVMLTGAACGDGGSPAWVYIPVCVVGLILTGIGSAMQNKVWMKGGRKDEARRTTCCGAEKRRGYAAKGSGKDRLAG